VSFTVKHEHKTGRKTLDLYQATHLTLRKN